MKKIGFICGIVSIITFIGMVIFGCIAILIGHSIFPSWVRFTAMGIWAIGMLIYLIFAMPRTPAGGY
jgi:ABC-type uncharacterized transport system permease subunit